MMSTYSTGGAATTASVSGEGSGGEEAVRDGSVVGNCRGGAGVVEAKEWVARLT